MEIIYSTAALMERISELKNVKKTIGFVPTMGALHEGHYSLINASLGQNNITICSIFVNPTQFNSADDLTKYPRTLKEDCMGLERAGCHIVFAPTNEDIYPGGADKFKTYIDLEGLDERMEGEHRPGHFMGVVQVVKRLLDIVRCDRLYMGQKDYQQFTIIKHMIKYYDLPVQLMVCPTLREKDGLAMSSRNRRLSRDHREKASIIYRVLCQSKEWLNNKSVIDIEETAMEYLSVSDFKPEYFTLINGDTLKPIENILEETPIVACTAVWAGEVRLIDNMILKN